MAQDNKEFTLEDILAEQRAQRELEAAEQAARRGRSAAAGQKAPTRPPEAGPSSAPAASPVSGQDAGAPAGSARSRRALPACPGLSAPTAPAGSPASAAQAQADLNAYATGSVELPLREEDSRPAAGRFRSSSRASRPKRRKRNGGGCLGRKKRVPDFDENEDDIYYGIQLKPIDEYRMGYDSSGELTSEEETYKALFDDSKKAIDEEVEQNFQRLPAGAPPPGGGGRADRRRGRGADCRRVRRGGSHACPPPLRRTPMPDSTASAWRAAARPRKA